MDESVNQGVADKSADDGQILTQAITLPTVSVTVVDAVATEGKPADTLRFRLRRTGSRTRPLTVHFRFEGTATKFDDFRRTKGDMPETLTIPAGAATVDLVAYAYDDKVFEGKETATMLLLADPAYTFTAARSSVVTIVDNDVAPVIPSVSVATVDASATEGNPSDTFKITFTRSGGNLSQPLTINFRFAGSATKWNDYCRPIGDMPESLTFAAGATTVDLIGYAQDDKEVEGNESFTLELLANSAYSFANAFSAPVMIYDNDVAAPTIPTISVANMDSTATEGNPNDTFKLTFTRSGGNIALPLTINFRFAGSATKWNDYCRPQGDMPESLTFAAGSTTVDLIGYAQDDKEVEGNEYFALEMLANPAYTFTNAFSERVTVVDNDVVAPPSIPSISIATVDAVMTEGNPNDTFKMTFTRSGGDIALPLTINFRFAGSATKWNDYCRPIGDMPESLTFAAGATTVDLIGYAQDDKEVEGNESFTLELLANSAYTFPVAFSSLVTIYDNDGVMPTIPVVSVSATDASASEADANDTFSFTFQRSGSLTSPLVVNFKFDGTATKFTDYRRAAGDMPETISFPVGASSVVVTAYAVNDSVVEGNENLTLELLPNPAYTFANARTSPVTLIDYNPIIPPPVYPASALAMNGPASAQAGLCAGPFFVHTRDLNNIERAVTAATSVSLGGKGTGQFYADAGCASAVNALTIAASSSVASFYFKDTAYNSASLPISMTFTSQATGLTGTSLAFSEYGTTAPPVNGVAYATWKNEVQPAIAASCASCHIGERFSYGSLARAGAAFTEDETLKNYNKFLEFISLDRPEGSRLIGKALPESHPLSLRHAGGARIAQGDAVYNTFLKWANQEKQERCPNCGVSSTVSYIAYVRQPASFWGIEKDPTREDWGVRRGAKIMLQKINPGTMQSTGEAPIDFLGASTFCGTNEPGIDGCDFGQLAVNHAGNMMAFECRRSVTGEKWLHRGWNICVANIGSDGRAVNPRYLRPQEKLQYGRTFVRTSPFMNAAPDGTAISGIYDREGIFRRRSDKTPVFSPDDQRIYFSSQSLDPRTGEDGIETYHGSEHLANIISVNLQGGDERTIYRNEGGTADSPFFMKNGNVGIHTWNLDRMDRHMYIQATADGMMELPVLFGRVQPYFNIHWGRAVQLNNGIIFGNSGRRRGAANDYVPFAADHTIGTGLDPAFPGFNFLNDSLVSEVDNYNIPTCQGDQFYNPNRCSIDSTGCFISSGKQCYQTLGECKNPPYGANCRISKYINDPSPSPDGRALVAYNDGPTYLGENGEDGWEFHRSYMNLNMADYYPKNFGISLMDHRGNATRVLNNDAGYIYRYPVWVGKRAQEKIQPQVTDENQPSTTLHIADFKVWMSFGITNEQNKASLFSRLDTIKAVRVSYKEMNGQACLADTVPRGMLTNGVPYDGADHPTNMGMADAAGFVQYKVPASLGGNVFGDINLEADNSVKFTVPKGKVMFIQGIDANGLAVTQHSRLFSLPPGHTVNTSVKRSQYDSQCMSCHGTLGNSAYQGMAQLGNMSTTPLDFNTIANSKPAIDLAAAQIVKKPLTYLSTLRPILNAKCISCHSGESPAAGLSLGSVYSSTGNYPAGLTPNIVPPEYSNLVPEASRRYSYNAAVPYSWALKRDDNNGLWGIYDDEIRNHTSIGQLNIYDPGYQNLFRKQSYTYYFLNYVTAGNFGRGENNNASKAFLVKVLTGLNTDPYKNVPTTVNHQTMLTEEEKRAFMAVIDNGFPYMLRCDGDPGIPKLLPSWSRYPGRPWGEPYVTHEHYME